MTLQKHMPLVLMIFALMCTLPAAMVPPSAIAQEENDEDDENLASSIVSDVLEDGSSDAEDESNQDATNTATEDSNQEQDVDEDNVSEFGDDAADLDDTNVAVPLAIPIDIDVIEEAPPITPPEEEEEPPEFVAFCHGLDGRIACYDTLEDCEEVGELFGAQCEGVETVPELACNCEVIEFMGVLIPDCQCPD